ncbi:uncharacterized protein ACLA_011210 [Aspergillus clavatus NRRL 1]|uniref:Mmc1 C-terminal domain-containing protein n=1 Tax=Aspergillus clavatus (strain ATCC 1007 / CBS 513.65 / DSM 816 / NCTC 3887 / NRRL 1 / QM 1276 / 107) TaxID=344612 RepID=A1CAC6_ASPCL|nr:uncharacterized protein ACLA_011210 [Aspergillus clavatus NRRL 1]EAW12694.1 conserved hypothetical protein [Aspergillus clavatus NRRL 1]
MPAKLRGSVAKTLSRPLDNGSVFYCSSCSTWRRTLSTRSRNGNACRQENRIPSSPSTVSANASRRQLATVPVNSAGRNVPAQYKELYEALNRAREAAPEQVNVSRLQLALRGLESEVPLVRVAVLGLNDATAARKLVRLLLADPLSPRESWEDILDSFDADMSRGLLIRYGEVSETIPNDLLPTISVPSSILKKGNIEILVSTLGAETEFSTSRLSADTFLVPTVTIRTSHSGRHNVVRYPVHRSIVCGSGADDLLAYSGLIARSNLKKEARSVHGVIEIPGAATESTSDRISFVDIHQADEALAKFRESVQNASLYERGWSRSGVQPVVDWLSSLRTEAGTLNPSLRTLIEALIDSAETGVVTEETRRMLEQEAESIPEEVREQLARLVSAWAERAHIELRGSLEEGFASKDWKDLAWWKLFWRVDDISMVTSEILEKKYLCRAEKEVIWTAGKFEQAGVLEGSPLASEDVVSESVEPDMNSSTPMEPSQPQAPWPTQIAQSRTKLLGTTVPSLHALAQRLVLFSVSTTTLTTALSALTYVSWPTTSIYETGTMAAVGLIYSLRNQQKKWDAARAFWEEEVRENGRTALLETEQELRTITQQGGRHVEEIAKTDARERIGTARKALDELD